MKVLIKEVQNVYYHFLHLNINDKKKFFRLFILCCLLFASWLIGYKWRDARIYVQNIQIELLKEKKNELTSSVNELEKNLEEYNFMLNDGDYYRYLAYKHSDISIPKSVNVDHLKLMTEHAKTNSIPLKYFFRLIWKESRYNPNAVSSMGARGYMQMIPSTFELYKARYPKNINKLNHSEQNIIIGTFMLSHLYKKYKRWDLTFAAYNAGSIVDECKCIPNITETQNYVKYIMNE